MPQNNGKNIDSRDENKRLEAKADVKTVYNKENSFYALKLETHHQGMELWGTVKPVRKGNILAETSLLKLFRELGLDGRVNKENLKLFCARACLGQSQEDVLLLEGVPPVKGADEYVDFVVRVSTDKAKYEKDGKGNINYHDLHLFENVKEGQLIGATHSPGEGTPGKSVTGENIPALKGKPFDKPPRLGPNVKEKRSEGGVEYYAMAPGRVIYEAGEISVSEDYIVKGDVGNITGDINFVGNVVISGNVKDDFNVKAGKCLTIKGTVGGKCVIESGGDMSLGGMTSKGDGVIRCGGTLTSRYLDGVSIECRGDIKVRNEIINSNVKCGGSIEVELGAVVGGYYSALCGIESKEIGTEAGVKTRINVGECYLVEQKKQKVHEKLASLAKEISFISQKLEPVVKNPKAMLALNASDKERIRGMAARFRELTPERNRLKAELNDIKKEIAERANPLVIARKQIQRGVEITIGSAFEKIHRRILRPVTVIKHAKKDKLLFTSKHSLSDRAFIIQNNLLKEELEEARLKKALEEKKKTQR